MIKAIVRVHSYGRAINFVKPFVELERESAVGSGTIVNPKELHLPADSEYLYILTCAHVIDKADQVTIVLPLKGSEQLAATVVSFVPKHNYDLAILALPNKNGVYNDFVRTLPLGESTKLVQGETLRALGFPMGQTGLKVSDGVFAGFQHYLQHTVSISPGNSGGPLINERGELVGINNAGLVHVAASNIGYAVPIELCLMTAPRMFIDIGPPGPHRVLRAPNFGFFLQPTTLLHIQHIAQVSDQGCCTSGMYIFEVVDGSPAFEAGVRPGDFLCAIGDAKVDNTGDVPVPWSVQKVPIKTALERYADPDQQYSFTIWSKRSQSCTTIQMSPRVLDVHSNYYSYPPYDTVAYMNIQGLIIMPLLRNHKEYPETLTTVLSLSPKERLRPHLVITYIVPGSPADQSQTLSAGDLLVSVDGSPVTSLDQLSSEGVHLYTNHNGKTTML